MLQAAEFARRRKELLKKLGEHDIAIVPSAKEIMRNNDAPYPFRQDSDFYYLTGFEEPDAVLMLIPTRQEGEYVLFNRPRDPDREVWEGPSAGQKGACRDYLADQSFPIDQLNDWLPKFILGKENVHYPIGINPKFDKKILSALRQAKSKVRTGVNAPIKLIDIAPCIHEMRLLKSDTEIASIQKAVDITAVGFEQALHTLKPGIFEYTLEAELIYAFKREGASGHAYTPIVGAGRNSCVLHYIANSAQIGDGDLVLIDAGAEYQNYAADITRVFPANGRFTEEQRAIYELVLAAQLAAIATVKPGALWTAPQDAIVKIITQGLIDLGLLKGRCSDLIEKEAYLPFYMHRSGHWLGLDVHDAGRYTIDRKWRTLQPGMVITVEPGIYISENIPTIPERWQKIGVRIEDDLLVTQTGNKVLSQHIPKNIDEIEAAMDRRTANSKRKN